MGDLLPGPPAVAGFKALGISGVPNRGVLLVRRANPAKLLREGGRNRGPMRAAIGGQKYGSEADHDPADFVRGSGTAEQLGEHPAGLPRPGGAAIPGEFDQAGASGKPHDVRARRRDQTRIGNRPGEFEGSRAVEAGYRTGRRFGGWRRSGHRSFYLLRIFHLVQGARAGHSLRSIIVLMLSWGVLRLRERGLNVSACGFFIFEQGSRPPGLIFMQDHPNEQTGGKSSRGSEPWPAGASEKEDATRFFRWR